MTKRLAEVPGTFFFFPAHVWSSGILFDPIALKGIGFLYIFFFFFFVLARWLVICTRCDLLDSATRVISALVLFGCLDFLELSRERLRFLLPFYTLSLLNSLKRLYRLAEHQTGGCVVGVSDAWSWLSRRQKIIIMSRY